MAANTGLFLSRTYIGVTGLICRLCLPRCARWTESAKK